MKRIVACFLLLVLVLSLCACSVQATTTKFNKKDCKVIAHRGLSGLALENTDTAFDLAGQHTYFGIEADVRKTLDGFVICHDANLGRISGKNVDVESSLLQDLLDIKLFGDEHLATLESYFSICKQYQKKAILELKSTFSRDEIAQIIDVAQQIEWLDQVIFISFIYDNLTLVREILPQAMVQFLFSSLSQEIVQKVIQDNFDVAIAYRALTKEALKTFHDAGLKVNCWTVDSRRVANKLASWGVDYITTNILE